MVVVLVWSGQVVVVSVVGENEVRTKSISAAVPIFVQARHAGTRVDNDGDAGALVWEEKRKVTKRLHLLLHAMIVDWFFYYYLFFCGGCRLLLILSVVSYFSF